jgi:gliding motility-associated-like protein
MRNVNHFRLIINTYDKIGHFVAVACLFILTGSVDDLQAQSTQRDARLTIHMPPSLEVCPNTPITVEADSVSGGSKPYRFAWFTASEIVSTDSSATIMITDTTICILQVMAADGAIERDTIQLTPYASIDAGFEVNTWEGCTPVEVRFTSHYLSFQNITDMSWDYGTGTIDHQLASAVFEYEIPGIYFPALTITDTHGCIWSDTLLIGVRVFPAPKSDFQLQMDKLYLPDTRLVPENTSEGATQYVWQFTGGAPLEGFEPDIQLPQNQEGIYELELYAENAYGCWHRSGKTIEVVQAIELFLPNAFTPDGDGINDVWQPKGLGIDSYHISIEIYDVWGTVVYTSSDWQAAWSGRSEPLGLYVPPGQYNYRIIARDTEHGIGHLFEGHVMVLR